MRALSAVAATILTAAPALAGAAPYDVDSAHSAAQFSVKHLMVSNVRGELGKVTGKLNLDDKDITKSTVEASIEVSGISTRDAKRDEHLKGPDFFDAAKYPTVTFKSTKVEKAGKGKLKVTGDLTMHGVTKPVVLQVEGPSAEVKDPWGNIKIAATATTKLSRKDFGIVYNAPLEAGGVVISDEVDVTLDLELNKAQAPTAAK